MRGAADRLNLLCHSVQVNWDHGNQRCTPDAHGGLPPAAPREGLTLWTVHLIDAWRGLIDLIVLFTCLLPDTYAPSAVPGARPAFLRRTRPALGHMGDCRV